MNKKAINATVLVLVLSTIAVALVFIGVFNSYQQLAEYTGVDWERVSNPLEVYAGDPKLEFSYDFRYAKYENCVRNCPLNCSNISCEFDCECIPKSPTIEELKNNDEDWGQTQLDLQREYLSCEYANCFEDCSAEPADWCPEECVDAEVESLCKKWFREEKDVIGWQPRNGPYCPQECSNETVWAGCEDDSTARDRCIDERERVAEKSCEGVTCNICEQEVAPIYCYDDSGDKIKSDCYDACFDFYSSSKNAKDCKEYCSDEFEDYYALWEFSVKNYMYGPRKINVRAYTQEDDEEQLVFDETSLSEIAIGDTFNTVFKGRISECEEGMTLRITATAIGSQFGKEEIELPEENINYPFCVTIREEDVNVSLNDLTVVNDGNDYTFTLDYSITGSDVQRLCPNATAYFYAGGCEGGPEVVFSRTTLNSIESDWSEYAPVGTVRIPFELTNTLGENIKKPEAVTAILDVSEAEVKNCNDLMITRHSQTGRILPRHIVREEYEDDFCSEVEVEFVLTYISQEYTSTHLIAGDTHYFYAYLGEGMADHLDNLDEEFRNDGTGQSTPSWFSSIASQTTEEEETVRYPSLVLTQEEIIDFYPHYTVSLEEGEHENTESLYNSTSETWYVTLDQFQ